MADEILRYDRIVEQALRSVVRTALSQVAAEGLPAPHQLYITFKTQYPGVEIDEFLAAQYPDEMTIVLQHQFWDLEVEDDRFSIGLNFNKQPHMLTIPFRAITAFADPPVQFGLKFERADEVQGTEGEKAGSADTAAAEDEPAAQEPAGDAEVVSLDQFRKK